MRSGSMMLPCETYWLQKSDLEKSKNMTNLVGFDMVFFLVILSNLLSFFHLKDIQTT